MARAAGGNHKSLVEFFISKGAANWNWAMAEAACKDHQLLVDFFISKGAVDWREVD